MVRFDRDRRTARERHALDHIRIERSLSQKVGAAELARLLVEDVDEQTADGLAFLFRVFNPIKCAQETVARVDMDQRNVVGAAEHRNHLIRLVHAHQTVINEDAGELIANRLVNEDCGNGGIDAAGEPTDHSTLTNLFLDFGNGFGAEMRHAPVARATGDL